MSRNACQGVTLWELRPPLSRFLEWPLYFEWTVVDHVNACYGLECFQVESAFLWFERVFTKQSMLSSLWDIMTPAI